MPFSPVVAAYSTTSSIYMITSVPCRAVPCVCAVRPSVAGCPGVRHGVPVDLEHVTKGGSTVVALSYHEIREAEQ